MAQILPIVLSSQKAALTVCSLFTIIPITFCILRVISRRILRMSLDSSDWLIFAACLVAVAYQGVCIAGVLVGGVGYHVAEIVPVYGLEPVTILLKLAIPIQVLWAVSLTFCKMSVLIFYVKIFTVRSLVIIAKVTGAVIMAWSVATVLMAFLLCQPFAYNWDQTIDGHCGDQVLSYKLTGAINLITDVLVLVLPMPYLYGLNLALYKKIVLMVTFAIGIFTCAVSIIRLVSLTSLDYTDLTFSITEALIFSPLEPSLAVSIACVPLLRPLVSRRKYSNQDTTQESSTFGSKHLASSGSKAIGKFQPLDDDNSQYQLRPIGPKHDVGVSTGPRGSFSGSSNQDDIEKVEDMARDNRAAIGVKKEWTITTDRRE